MKTKKQRKRNPKQKPTKTKKQRDQIETQNTKTKNKERGTEKPMKTKNREIWVCCFCWRSEVVGLLKIMWDLGLWDLQKNREIWVCCFCWRSEGVGLLKIVWDLYCCVSFCHACFNMELECETLNFQLKLNSYWLDFKEQNRL